MRRNVTASMLCILLALASIPTGLRAESPLRLAIVVRHGEKLTSPKENPPLSPAGQARAQALLDTLRDAHLTTIITTQQTRTRETAAPLLAALDVQHAVVPTMPDPAAHAQAVADAARRSGGTVLIVDHQITIPRIIAALGGPAMPTMCDVEFSNLYLLIPKDVGRMDLVQLHYGAQDPPHGKDCHITPVSPP